MIGMGVLRLAGSRRSTEAMDTWIFR